MQIMRNTLSAYYMKHVVCYMDSSAVNLDKSLNRIYLNLFLVAEPLSLFLLAEPLSLFLVAEPLSLFLLAEP